jgi:hypothetical protein
VSYSWKSTFIISAQNVLVDCLVGPHVLLCQLTGNHYQDFLLCDLQKLLEDVLLAVRAQKLYVHDGAVTHFSHAMQGVLNDTYHDQWINRGWPTAWPPHLSDFNPLDFYLWGHLKTLVYAAPVDNKEALHNRIVDACQTICNYLGIFEWMQWSMMRRVEACIVSHGGHFEHLL